ncbi:hypothetical protein N9L68_01080 [bacterium]|nr:hypothetical protein [bacterium]
MGHNSGSTTAARASERCRMIRHSVDQASVAEANPIRPDIAPPASLACDNMMMIRLLPHIRSIRLSSSKSARNMMISTAAVIRRRLSQ